MNRRSFVASLAALFAWMLPKPPRKRFVQRTFPNPVRDERLWYLDINKGPEVWHGVESGKKLADAAAQQYAQRRMTRTELTLPPGQWRWSYEAGVPVAYKIS